MKRALWTRIAVYSAAMIAVMVAVGFASYRTWVKIQYWQDIFSALQEQSLAAAHEFRQPFRDVNLQLVRFLLLQTPAEKNAFLAAREGMKKWFTNQLRSATMPEVRETLLEMQESYTGFIAATDALLPAVTPGRPIDPNTEVFLGAERTSRRLLELDSKFAEIQEEGRRSLYARTRADLEWMESALYMAMSLITLLTVWVGRTVYRKYIAPLQLKLVETQAIVERQEKLSALGTMAAGVAHEIRNPLTAVKVRLFTQRKQLQDLPSALEDNRFISEEITRLEKIVREFLQFARPAEPEFQLLRVSGVVKHIGELLGPELARSGIALQLDPAFDPEISADAGQLQQALINLVRNSAESIEQNGIIVIRTRPARGRRKDGTSLGLALEVEDNGKGMPAEVQRRLFDPFFTTRPSGTGLGLSIVARIIQAHGGVIEFQSNPRLGTVFRLLLPLASGT